MRRISLSAWVGLCLLGASALAGPASAATIPPSGEIEFEVVRGADIRFGAHTVRFYDGMHGELRVETDISLRAGLGPITVFRYELSGDEIWRGGRLESARFAGRDDGKDVFASAEYKDGVYTLGGSNITQDAIEAPLIASTYWNKALIEQGRMFNTQNGEILPFTVERLGWEEITDAYGRPFRAEHYRLTSNIVLDLWYDEAGMWSGLAFTARGQEVRYKLKSPEPAGLSVADAARAESAKLR